MVKTLLIGGSIVGGIFVGFVAYKVTRKKGPKLLAAASKKVSDVGKKASKIIADTKQGFSEGFTQAYAGQAPATA